MVQDEPIRGASRRDILQGAVVTGGAISAPIVTATSARAMRSNQNTTHLEVGENYVRDGEPDIAVTKVWVKKAFGYSPHGDDAAIAKTQNSQLVLAKLKVNRENTSQSLPPISQFHFLKGDKAYDSQEAISGIPLFKIIRMFDDIDNIYTSQYLQYMPKPDIGVGVLGFMIPSNIKNNNLGISWSNNTSRNNSDPNTNNVIWSLKNNGRSRVQTRVDINTIKLKMPETINPFQEFEMGFELQNNSNIKGDFVAVIRPKNGSHPLPLKGSVPPDSIQTIMKSFQFPSGITGNFPQKSSRPFSVDQLTYELETSLDDNFRKTIKVVGGKE